MARAARWTSSGCKAFILAANAITFGADQISNIEQIVLLTGGDTGSARTAGYSYDVTMNDGNVVSGGTMVITANTLRSDETLTFNGGAETDGRFRIFSGAGADVIRGGAGNDEIFGGAGNDDPDRRARCRQPDRRGSNDRFVFAAAESTPSGPDQILGFASGDLIDLTAIDTDAALATRASRRSAPMPSAAVRRASHLLRRITLGGGRRCRWRRRGPISSFTVVRSDAAPLTDMDFLL
jgi:hypothetical protein